LIVESHRESLIFAAAQHTVKKIHRGFLLEFEPVAYAVRSIEQHADAQRKVRLSAEEPDLLLRVVVGNLEIVLFQVGYQLVAAIEHRGQNVHEVDFGSESWLLLLLRIGGSCRLLRRLWLLSTILLGEVREGEGEQRYSCEQSEGRGEPWGIHDVKV